jgi:DNA polymerase-3 subunit delta'
VPTPQNSEVRDYLKTIPEISLERAEEAAIISDGNLNKALKLALNDDADPYFTLFIQWMRTCFQPNVPEMLIWVEAFSKTGRENQKAFLTYSIEVLRKFLLLNFGINALVNLSNSERTIDPKFIQGFPKKIHGGNISGLIELLGNAQYHIERNGNPKIILTDTSLKISQLLKMPN